MTRRHSVDFDGIGRWRFRSSDTWPKDVLLAQEERRRTWRRFAGEGVVIELPPLKTKQDRSVRISDFNRRHRIP